MQTKATEMQIAEEGHSLNQTGNDSNGPMATVDS